MEMVVWYFESWHYSTWENERDENVKAIISFYIGWRAVGVSSSEQLSLNSEADIQVLLLPVLAILIRGSEYSWENQNVVILKEKGSIYTRKHTFKDHVYVLM